jgi:hypothetical protein
MKRPSIALCIPQATAHHTTGQESFFITIVYLFERDIPKKSEYKTVYNYDVVAVLMLVIWYTHSLTQYFTRCTELASPLE